MKEEESLDQRGTLGEAEREREEEGEEMRRNGKRRK